jgi:transcriptional regulator with GAF, ATPase, and Fis domain
LENPNAARTRDVVRGVYATQALLADVLTVQGIALARLDKPEPAALSFQEAIVVAMQAGAQDKASLAALTWLEEIEQISPQSLCDAMEIATEMPETMGIEMLKRVANAGFAVVRRMQIKSSHQGVPELDLKLRVNLEYEMLMIERHWIRKALADAHGSIILGADFLGLKPKKLFRRLRLRHPALCQQLSP